MCIAKMSAATLKTYQKWTINANFLKLIIKVAQNGPFLSLGVGKPMLS